LLLRTIIAHRESSMRRAFACAFAALIASSPEDFGAQMENDVARWGTVVEKAGMAKN
jgi:hypothetical protein